MLKKVPYYVPDIKKIRVIIDTDCFCEADDQFAVAHALMTSKFDIAGILSEHYSDKFWTSGPEESEHLSLKEIHKVLELMDLKGTVPVFSGCKAKLPNETTFVESAASRFIIEEAMREDSRPLFVVNQGALTNLASAYLMEPSIANKLTAIWIGGGQYPNGEFEFNLDNDIGAANVIMDSDIPLWQVPRNVYMMVKVSFATLQERVYPYGKLGKYLVDRMMQFEKLRMESPQFRDAVRTAEFVTKHPCGESWHLGDSPVVGLMMNDHEGHYQIIGAPRFQEDNCHYILRPENTRKIRVYEYVDSYFILEDFFAKLKYQYGD